MTPGSDEAISQAERAYLLTREAIIAGQHPFGSRLTERVISETLSMSRVPVREALRRLEDEGYIRTYPQRGAIVNQLTLKDATELFDLERNLEVLAAQKAAVAVAEGRTPDRLEYVLTQNASRTKEVGPTELQWANTDFHTAIAEMSGNDLLIKTIAPLRGRIRWLMGLTAPRAAEVELAEHVALYEAICHGNADLAGALAFAHIEQGRAASLPSLARVLPPN